MVKKKNYGVYASKKKVIEVARKNIVEYYGYEWDEVEDDSDCVVTRDDDDGSELVWALPDSDRSRIVATRIVV